MLLFDAGLSLRDGALKSGPKACRERPTVKEKAASPSTLRLGCDLGNPIGGAQRCTSSVTLEWKDTDHGDVG